MVQKQPIALGLVSKFINEPSKLDFRSQEMQEKIMSSQKRWHPPFIGEGRFLVSWSPDFRI